jgi:uncharacterized protein YecE (DUF72 family)
MTIANPAALYGLKILFIMAMVPNIYIGTSGWSYKGWRGAFYPQKLPATRWLLHYASVFSTTEINGSFYRLPSIETVRKWTAEVPDDFVFCPKMSRFLTHMKKLCCVFSTPWPNTFTAC